MILIVRGRDVHTNRLELGLKSLSKEYITITEPDKDILSKRYDLAFVDPSFKYDISSNLKAEKVLFYDTEDGPEDFFPDTAYHTLKCSTYAKMNYIEDDRGDGIKNIGFPLYSYVYLSEFARAIGKYKSDRDRIKLIPYFVGHPTFIGKYPTPESLKYKNNNKLGIKIISDSGMYNQRYDWLVSLHQNYNSLYAGGIVFAAEDNNMNYNWQRQHFGGNITRLVCSKISIQDNLNNTYQLGIGLSPTGHERLSWRFLDIMATGSILFMTDYHRQRSMYMPKEAIIVKDTDDLATVLKSYERDLRGLLKAHDNNRLFMASLTPEKIWDDFINSIE